MAGKKTDYIIVGAGLAGISLALELVIRGKQVILFDCHQPSDSSRIAAGIIHPIVPKGARLTWMGNAVFPLIEDWYKEWEARLESTFYQPLSGYQIHPNEETAAFWQKRSHTAEMNAWMHPVQDSKLTGITSEYGYTPISQCARLNTVAFLEAALSWLRKKIEIRHTEFEYQDLSHVANEWYYGDEKSGGVIFCQGIKVMNNPWFQHLHFHPTAGDILTLNFNNNLPAALYKNRNWLVPDGNGNWLAGSTFHKGSLNTEPMAEDADRLQEQIRLWTDLPFTLLNHKRGVRPTVEGRRPYLGEHSEAKGIYIFNGLGSKGSSLIPWLSPMMAEFLCHGKYLHPDVNISRFAL